MKVFWLNCCFSVDLPVAPVTVVAATQFSLFCEELLEFSDLKHLACYNLSDHLTALVC